MIRRSLKPKMRSDNVYVKISNKSLESIRSSARNLLFVIIRPGGVDTVQGTLCRQKKSHRRNINNNSIRGVLQTREKCLKIFLFFSRTLESNEIYTLPTDILEKLSSSTNNDSHDLQRIFTDIENIIRQKKITDIHMFEIITNVQMCI